MSFLFLVEKLQTGFLIIGSLALLIAAGIIAEAVTAAADFIKLRLVIFSFFFIIFNLFCRSGYLFDSPVVFFTCF